MLMPSHIKHSQLISPRKVTMQPLAFILTAVFASTRPWDSTRTTTALANCNAWTHIVGISGVLATLFRAKPSLS
ncbi:hypothetical protein Cob_v000073 [Colletotrichum orbiculare MAFF 240422]|uniref:Uncharacterized protein n=1 Tax=Colletotrichum orbiculare (strain 104-T / ATCC 96160 / CBS 514.97 / LARS 414 / MAFF 240422) TaxID=1213857 RepID=A0A484GAQ7_COLOR|nr:hypothetical protein Cob_v000073 [Colletotrichum orbiculare MAFF 240422]